MKASDLVLFILTEHFLKKMRRQENPGTGMLTTYLNNPDYDIANSM